MTFHDFSQKIFFQVIQVFQTLWEPRTLDAPGGFDVSVLYIEACETEIVARRNYEPTPVSLIENIVKTIAASVELTSCLKM